MAGQTARALQGSFNTVPVLHSNQPEAVNGPGILIDTSPGIAYFETGLAMVNPTFRFEGPFGLHFHHLYSPSSPGPDCLGRRPELSLAAVVIHPSGVPVRLRLFRGAVRNSFAAPYRGHQLLGVKPLGPRPWNTALAMPRPCKCSGAVSIPTYRRNSPFHHDLAWCCCEPTSRPWAW